MNNYNYAIFDLDGTLLDTSQGVIAAAVQAMKELSVTKATFYRLVKTI